MPLPRAILCSRCLGLVPIQNGKSSVQPHHATVASFRESSQTCVMCRFIIHALKTSGRPWAGRPEWNKSYCKKELSDDAEVSLQVENIQQLKDHLISAECLVRSRLIESHCMNKIVITACDMTCEYILIPNILSLTVAV